MIFSHKVLRSNMNRVYGINTDDANLVINYVNKLQVDQIRPLSIQNILKFICMLYQEKKKIGANSTTPLHIYLYDFFFSQVGLKKITEDKMKKVKKRRITKKKNY